MSTWNAHLLGGPAGHGAVFISDGTNWRCIGAY